MVIDLLCVLELILKCGLFLRQAGHYEQLLTLINMYLSISINHFDNDLIENFLTASSDDISKKNYFILFYKCNYLIILQYLMMS